jgi:hypothetical protein
MSVDHIEDSSRPVLQITAAPDLRGGWSIELQVVWLDGRKLVEKGIGTGTTAAGLVAGVLEMLQQAHEAGHHGVPTASCTLWTVATGEAQQ